MYDQKKPQSSMKKTNDVNLEALQLENLELKEELRKEMYRIEIRRKAGAKQ